MRICGAERTRYNFFCENIGEYPFVRLTKAVRRAIIDKTSKVRAMKGISTMKLNGKRTEYAERTKEAYEAFVSFFAFANTLIICRKG